MAGICENSSDQFESFLDLDILGRAFSPLFEVHGDVHTSAHNFSTDSSFNIDPLDIDLQDELDKMLKSIVPDSSLNVDEQFNVNFQQSDLDFNNNDHEFTVKEEIDIHDSFLNQNMQEDQVKEELLPREEDQSSEITGPTIKHVRHIRSMPERTSAFLMSNSRKRYFSQTNQGSQIFQLGNLEGEVIYTGGSIVLKQNHKAFPGPVTKGFQIPTGRSQGMTRSLMRIITEEPSLNRPQLKSINLNPVLDKVNGAKNIPHVVKLTAPCKVVLVRNSKARPPKIRRGISILKTVTKEDPTKEKKNEQERNRRGTLAMYRDELRKMLPQIQGVEKVPTITVLEMAREHCVVLQHRVDVLQTVVQMEEDRNAWLKRMLEVMSATGQYQEEEPVTIGSYMENFEF